MLAFISSLRYDLAYIKLYNWFILYFHETQNIMNVLFFLTTLYWVETMLFKIKPGAHITKEVILFGLPSHV